MADNLRSAPQKTRENFRNNLLAMSNGHFELLELWEGGWEMKVSEFPVVEWEGD
jgi:hypothetical protein